MRDIKERKPILWTTRHWQGRFTSVVEDEVDLGDAGGVVRREYMMHPGAVAVVALRGQAGAEEVLLEYQYRHAAGVRMWEIPAGLLDVAGENPVEAAQRELAEETDYSARTWHVLVEYFNSPGISTESVRIFLARDLTELDQTFAREDEEADMELRWVPLTEAVRGALEGRFHNPSLVAGVLAAEAARAQGWESLRPADAEWLR